MLVGLLFTSAAQVAYEIKKLPFNTQDYNEFAAVPYSGGIVFCSDRKENLLVTYSDQDNNTLTDIFFTSYRKRSWTPVQHFSSSISTILNEGPASFTPAGDKIYFTRNIDVAKQRAAKKNPLGIFSAELIDGEWKNIASFSYNSNEYATGHPCISPSGQQLYFISDMPGGYGGTDIYMCELKDGKWGQPVNLGPAINTEANEMFPFISKKGELYFSSNRRDGAGGLDIYVSKQANGSWEKPKHMPSPINSFYDDFAFVCDASGKKGYFSSHRDGTDDIYSFELPVPDFEKCDSLKKNNYCFVFFEEGIEQSDSLPVSYEWDFGDGTKMKSLEADHCFKGPGTYAVQLNVIDNTTGDVFYSEASYDLEVQDNEQVYINSPDTLLPGQAVQFDGIKTHLKDFKPYAYYWDFGAGMLDTGAVTSHLFASNGVYDVRLGVTSIKDNAGNFQKACVYKRIVVTDRAPVKTVAAVKKQSKELKDEKAVPPVQKPLEEVYRVEVMNSKEQIPLDDAKFSKLSSSYTVQENYIAEKELYSYTVGEAKSLAATWPIYKDIKAKGYDEARVKSYADNIVSLDKMATLSRSEMTNKVVRINNALFDPGKYNITKDAMAEMDKLYNLMRNNPEMSADISAHTDNEGSETSNLELSIKRANAIVDYLTSKGIDSSRLNPKGYGESRPIADNSTAAGRKLNRRVEIKINWK